MAEVCYYNGLSYSPGATTCQSGRKKECLSDGQWLDLGTCDGATASPIQVRLEFAAGLLDGLSEPDMRTLLENAVIEPLVRANAVGTERSLLRANQKDAPARPGAPNISLSASGGNGKPGTIGMTGTFPFQNGSVTLSGTMTTGGGGGGGGSKLTDASIRVQFQLQ